MPFLENLNSRWFLLVLLLVSYFWVWNKAMDLAQAHCNTEKQETISDAIEIRLEQDKVSRPDNAALIDSMQRGTF